MVAGQASLVVRDREVGHHPGPERRRQPELVRIDEGQRIEPRERRLRHDLLPDREQILQSQIEGANHRLDRRGAGVGLHR